MLPGPTGGRIERGCSTSMFVPSRSFTGVPPSLSVAVACEMLLFRGGIVGFWGVFAGD